MGNISLEIKLETIYKYNCLNPTNDESIIIIGAVLFPIPLNDAARI
jgi:hypothetical protein